MPIVRVKSHRARRMLDDLLADTQGTPREFWAWDTPHHFVMVPRRLLSEARKIKGITLAKIDHSLLRPTINWSA